MDHVISENQSLFSTALHLIREGVYKELSDNGVSQRVIVLAIQHLEDTSSLTRIYSGLETQHKETSYFRKKFRIVVSSLYLALYSVHD